MFIHYNSFKFSNTMFLLLICIFMPPHFVIELIELTEEDQEESGSK